MSPPLLFSSPLIPLLWFFSLSSMVAEIKLRGITMASPIKVDEEYNNALRTESYTDLYAKVHDHGLQRAASADTTPKKGDIVDGESEESHRSLHTTHSSPLPYRHYIPDFLAEPSQESLVNAVNNSSADSRRRSRFHHHLDTLLLDFFDATLQACVACSVLLSSIDRARSHHRSIHRLLLLLTLRSSTSDTSSFSQLSSHLELDNPLSPDNLSHFHLIHSRYPPLVRNLTSARRKIVRRQKLVSFTQSASGVAAVALFGAVVVAAAVVATHAAVTMAVVPIAVAAAGGRMRRKMGKWVKGWRRLERARARMDVATKGAYIVGRDLDTMSRIVARVRDEVEHGRDVARMVVRNREWEMATEVVREMEGRGGEVGMGLEEQLEELEEHVYLCLITINRSRRLVAQEMMRPHAQLEVPVV